MSKLFNGYVTHPGLVRKQNEDYLGFYPTENGTFVIVADGMGGMGNGQVASKLAVDTMRDIHVKNPTTAPMEVIRTSAVAANQAIANEVAQHPELDGMGTTVVVAFFKGNQVFIGHVGDSRAYLIRPKQILQITKDHTSVQQMVDEGLIAPEQAATHPMAHVVQRALGHRKNFEMEIAATPLDLQSGDTLLLCSDGLTDLVKDNEIQSIVAEYDPQTACNILLDLALNRGAHDNTTIQIIRYGVKTWSEQVRRTSKISPIPKEAFEKDSGKPNDTVFIPFSWARIPFLWKIRLVVLLFILLFLGVFIAFSLVTSPGETQPDPDEEAAGPHMQNHYVSTDFEPQPRCFDNEYRLLV